MRCLLIEDVVMPLSGHQETWNAFAKFQCEINLSSDFVRDLLELISQT